MPFINQNDLNLFYKIKGAKKSSNTALMFIHGSGENSSVWKNQIKGLTTDCDIIALDLPAHGKSNVFEIENLSLGLYVDVVKKIKEELNYQKLIISGHSLGGAIAQEFYFKYPNDVIGLILIGTGAKLRVHPDILDNLKNDFQAYLDSIAIAAFYRKTDEKIINQYVNEVSKLDPEVIYQDFKICDRFDVMEKIEKIDIPTLMIVGHADKLTPVKYSKYLKEKIHDSSLKVVQGAGHSVLIEKPKQVNQIIENFTENIL